MMACRSQAGAVNKGVCVMRRWISVFALAAALTACSGDNVDPGQSGAQPTATPGVVQGKPGQPQVDPAAPGIYPVPVPGQIPGAGDPNLEVTEIQVDSVEVVIRESQPPQVAVHVKGTLGD